jgi:hypothetical protein
MAFIGFSYAFRAAGFSPGFSHGLNVARCATSTKFMKFNFAPMIPYENNRLTRGLGLTTVTHTRTIDRSYHTSSSKLNLSKDEDMTEDISEDMTEDMTAVTDLLMGREVRITW